MNKIFSHGGTAMNGKKILVRLIWLFLCINIVLFILNLSVTRSEYRLTNQQIKNIESVLEEQGIRVETELPQEYAPKKMGNVDLFGMNARYTIEKNFFGKNMMSVKHSVDSSKMQPDSDKKVQYCSFDQETLAFDGDYIFYENKALDFIKGRITEEDAKDYCMNLIKRLYPEDENRYEIQVAEKEDYLVLKFYPLFEGIPVLDAYMEFNVCENGVFSATFYMGRISPVSAEKKDIYPVNLVLFGCKEYIEQVEAAVITEVKLVYKKLPNNDEMWEQEIVPMYKITVAGLEEAIFVNAYTNEVMK